MMQKSCEARRYLPHTDPVYERLKSPLPPKDVCYENSGLNSLESTGMRAMNYLMAYFFPKSLIDYL